MGIARILRPRRQFPAIVYYFCTITTNQPITSAVFHTGTQLITVHTRDKSYTFLFSKCHNTPVVLVVPKLQHFIHVRSTPMVATAHAHACPAHMRELFIRSCTHVSLFPASMLVMPMIPVPVHKQQKAAPLKFGSANIRDSFIVWWVMNSSIWILLYVPFMLILWFKKLHLVIFSAPARAILEWYGHCRR